MPVAIGIINALFRYPVKSMRGEQLKYAQLGLHGIEGDRRYAIRRVTSHSDFPWLTARKLADLLHFAPQLLEGDSQLEDPLHVQTPDGHLLPILSEELRNEIEQLCGESVEMVKSNRGIFDESHVSAMSTATVEERGRRSATPPDVRRFRPNIVVRLSQNEAFGEDRFVGSTLVFGEGSQTPSIKVLLKDVRCMMVNLDPDSGSSNPEVLKAVSSSNQNCAGIYGTVVQSGRLEVGQNVYLL